MKNAAELAGVATAAVAEHLRYEGWNVSEFNADGSGFTDVCAAKDGVTILVRIKAARSPQKPNVPTNEEVQQIISLAIQIQAAPYVALVQLDPSKAPSIRYLKVR